MVKLLRVTREMTGGISALYLYYCEGETVAETIDFTPSGSLAMDVNDAGETIGIELIAPGREELEILTKVARERDLSLDGFSLVGEGS